MTGIQGNLIRGATVRRGSRLVLACSSGPLVDGAHAGTLMTTAAAAGGAGAAVGVVGAMSGGGGGAGVMRRSDGGGGGAGPARSGAKSEEPEMASSTRPLSSSDVATPSWV